jgi:Tol biopolymer transport system component
VRGLPRTVGQLLYTGTLDGRRGIILADLATGAQRLLTGGHYGSLAWSPDGARFAALGLATSEVPTQQVAIFGADGRAQARYPIPLSQNPSGRLLWSPDGRTLLYAYSDPVTGRPISWLVDEAGQRTVEPFVGAWPWHWTPAGRLAFVVQEGGSGAQAITAVWTVDARGDDSRREVAGAFLPLAWSADGATIVAGGGLQPFPDPSSRQSFLPTELVVIDRATGSRQTLPFLSAAEIGAVWITRLVSTPDASLFALVLREARGGTPTAGTMNTLVTLERGGRRRARATPWSDLYSPRILDWSPDGRHLVYDASGPGGREIRVAAPFGDTAAAYPARVPAALLLRAAWSPDGRWLAFTDSGGITLVPGDPTQERAYILTADGDAPAWRPGR